MDNNTDKKNGSEMRNDLCSHLESIHVEASVEWKKLSISGVYVQMLKTFEEGGSTVLIKMDTGSSFLCMIT